MQVDKSKENLKECKCMSCPSYSMGCKMKNMPSNMLHMVEGSERSEHFEGLFCAFGKSNCIDKDKGCNCPDCEVTKKYSLESGAYCLKN